MSSHFRAAAARISSRCASATSTAWPSSAPARSREKKSPRCSTTATFPRSTSSCSMTTNRSASWRRCGDEITFIQSVRPEQFENVDFTFFASDAECTGKNWKTARKAGSAIIDLSYALEDEPDAAVRSPWIERQLGQLSLRELQPGPAVVAHPAAVVLALLLLRARRPAL